MHWMGWVIAFLMVAMICFSMVGPDDDVGDLFP